MLNHSPACHHPHFSVIGVPVGDSESKSALGESALGTGQQGATFGTDKLESALGKLESALGTGQGKSALGAGGLGGQGKELGTGPIVFGTVFSTVKKY